METTFPRLLLQHAAQRPAAPAMREKEYGIWQTHSWADMAQMVEQIACGLHQAGLRAGEHMVVVGANRPRLYADHAGRAVAGRRAGAAVPGRGRRPSACSPSITPMSRFAFAEDQEQVDKLLEMREQCPQLTAIYYDDPRGLRKYSEPGLQALDALIAAGQAFGQADPGVLRDPGRARPGRTTWPRCSSPPAPPATPRAWCTPTAPCWTVPQAGAQFDKLTPEEEVLAYLPPAWIGQNIFSYAQWLACGYVVNCPESAGHRGDRPEGDRARPTTSRPRASSRGC